MFQQHMPNITYLLLTNGFSVDFLLYRIPIQLFKLSFTSYAQDRWHKAITRSIKCYQLSWHHTLISVYPVGMDSSTLGRLIPHFVNHSACITNSCNKAKLRQKSIDRSRKFGANLEQKSFAMEHKQFAIFWLHIVICLYSTTQSNPIQSKGMFPRTFHLW